MYEIFGVPVSGSKYYDLKKRTFSVPGDENCTLDDIKMYASLPTNGEFAKHYPGRIEAAKEVYNSVMKEIGGKTMSTRKTLNTKHQTFAEYLTDLEGVYTSSRAKLLAATEKYRLERERYEKSQKDHTLSRSRRADGLRQKKRIIRLWMSLKTIAPQKSKRFVKTCRSILIRSMQRILRASMQTLCVF